MTKINSIKVIKTLGLALAVGLSARTGLATANFSAAEGNVIICFRPGAGGDDLIVNAGTLASFTNLAPNTKISINAYTGQQLADLKDTNNLSWTAMAFYSNTNAATALRLTMCMSNPRSDLNTQSAPYLSHSTFTQGSTINKLNPVVSGAVDNNGYSALNSSTAVLESDAFNLSGQAVSYLNAIGANFNWGNTFLYDPETTTPADFTTSHTPVRADFYWLPPSSSSAPGTFLGYFEMNTNGLMTYTAYPSATVNTPVITSFARHGYTNSITFTTGSIGTYTLRGTNSAGLNSARANWPVVTSVLGDGNSHTLMDTNSTLNKFYIISAQ